MRSKHTWLSSKETNKGSEREFKWQWVCPACGRSRQLENHMLSDLQQGCDAAFPKLTLPQSQAWVDEWEKTETYAQLRITDLF